MHKDRCCCILPPDESHWQNGARMRSLLRWKCDISLSEFVAEFTGVSPGLRGEEMPPKRKWVLNVNLGVPRWCASRNPQRQRIGFIRGRQTSLTFLCVYLCRQRRDKADTCWWSKADQLLLRYKYSRIRSKAGIPSRRIPENCRWSRRESRSSIDRKAQQSRIGKCHRWSESDFGWFTHF